MKDIKMSHEELTRIWESELLIAQIDPFAEVPECVVEVLHELSDREDKFLDTLAEYKTLLNEKMDF